jgi:hypothetical protein
MQNYLNNKNYSLMKEGRLSYDKRWKALQALTKQLEEENPLYLAYFFNTHCFDIFDILFFYLTK